VDLGGDEQRGAADAGGAAPGLDPVPLHGLYQLQRRGADQVHAVAEVKPRREAVHIQARVDRPAKGVSKAGLGIGFTIGSDLG